jgi:type II secretory pathway component PulM
MIKAFWDKLEKKQRYMVVAAAAFVFFALVLELVIFPFGEAVTKAKRQVAANQIKLEEMIQLDAEFARHRYRMAQIKQVMSTRTSEFSLFSYLEKKAIQARVKGNIKQMNASRGMRSSFFEETLVDLRLEKITVKQLAEFLSSVESPAELVRIKRIAVSKAKGSPEYLSVQMQIVCVTAVNPHQGGS